MAPCLRLYSMMSDFNLEEAQLFRMLTSFFGRDRIVPHMSVMAVCGGELPSDTALREAGVPTDQAREDLAVWTRENRCLFTVVDGEDSPKLVMEFAPFENGTIEADRLEYQRKAVHVLKAAGVPMLTIRYDEFAEMLKPSGNLDLFSFLKGRFEDLGFNFGSGSE